MSEEQEQSPRVGRFVRSGTRAKKWLFGLLLAGVAAAITSYVTGGITWGVDHVRGVVEEEPAPVGVTVTHSARRGSGHWVLAGPLSSVRSLPLPTGDRGDIEVWDAWAKQHGGVDGDMSAVEVVIEGATPYPVVLMGLTVDVVKRSPPSGVHVVPFGGGPVGVRYFEVDLDKSPPTIASLPAEFDSTPAIDFPYRVSQTEPEVLQIRAYTLDCDCSWRANLQWVYHGKSGTTVVDDDGTPFRTVSGSGLAEYNPPTEG